MSLKQLHDSDFNLWIEEIKIKIQNRDFQDMDWESLLDEIEDMGASQKRALDSYMQRLIEHILKLKVISRIKYTDTKKKMVRYADANSTLQAKKRVQSFIEIT